jgi:chromosome segregation ATPase
VASLLQMQLDDVTAYKSAFTTAATVGLTKEKLIETASYYKNVVEKEREQFDKALDHQNSTKIVARGDEMKRLRDQIERHKNEIARLQDEMADYLRQIEQAESNMKSETEKLTKAKTAFEKTHQSVVLQIEKDIENMHKYL